MNLLAPRLDLRQSQSLVMTPQLRQAIKLLQSSNLEVSAFVEEELERNPLLERDERAPPGPDDAIRARCAAGDRPRRRRRRRLPRRHRVRHAAGGGARRRWMPSGTTSTTPTATASATTAATHGRGGARRLLRRPQRRRGHGAVAAHPARAPGRAGPARPSPIPADRLIAAQLLALVDPAGRLAAEDAALAAALGCEAARVAAVRARMQRFDPTGMFCRDLRECLAVQLAEQNRLDPAMQALLDNLDLLAQARPAGADAGLRRRRRGPGRHDRRDPAARPQAGRLLRRRAGAAGGAGPPDAPGAGRRAGCWS